MNIIVCIKQVPGTNKVNVDPVTGTLIRDGVAAKMNPYDLFALETALTPELEAEGLAREFISKLQGLRKELDFEVADRIDVTCETDEATAAVLADYRDYICRETLTENLVFAAAGSDAVALPVNDVLCRVAVRRAGSSL